MYIGSLLSFQELYTLYTHIWIDFVFKLYVDRRKWNVSDPNDLWKAMEDVCDLILKFT